MLSQLFKAVKLSLLFHLVIISCSFIQPLMAQDTRSLEWDMLFDGTFNQEGIGTIRWMAFGAAYSSLNQVEGNQIITKNHLNKGESELIFDASNFKSSSDVDFPIIDSYAFSEDERFVLFSTEQERIWRRSRKANYLIFDRQSKSIEALAPDLNEKQSLAEFSPDYKYVGFVSENNLYLREMNSQKVIQLTTDGQKNSIINGTTDWVYEEEFYLTKAWVWTKDAKSIGYLRFDETNVPEFKMENWNESYSDYTVFKYPKAGEQNSEVSIWSCSVERNQRTKVDLGEFSDWYKARIYSGADAKLFYVVLVNRLQNSLKIIECTAGKSSFRIVYEETGPYWLDMNETFEFFPGGESFLWISDKSGYAHLYEVQLTDGSSKQITSGSWDVEEVFGYDEVNDLIYFSSTKDSPIERHLYRINRSGSDLFKLTDLAGWHSLNFSKDLSYYIDAWSKNNEPTQYRLYRSLENELVRELETNDPLKKELEAYRLPQKEFLYVPNEVGDSLITYLIKPSNFDPTKTYPLLMYVYGGPRSQQVRNQFSMSTRDLFHHWMAEQGIIVACVDNRGTGGRGRNFKKQVYKRLGEYETADQISAANYFAEKAYIDPDRIGIWGWSYGGYVSTLSLAKGADVFKAAAAVAPVTHWKFYDTIYTERFMQTPQQNPEGYNAYAPIRLADQIKPHSYFYFMAWETIMCIFKMQ